MGLEGRGSGGGAPGPVRYPPPPHACPEGHRPLPLARLREEPARHRGHARRAGHARLCDRRAPRGRRRRGGEHLLVHRERARGVGEGDPRRGGPARVRPPARARRRRLHAPALRRRAREGAARGRRLRGHRRLPGDRGHPRRRARRAKPRGLRRGGPHAPLRPRLAAPAHRPGPLGLREDRRGLRPHLRVLRHPGHSRALPEPHAREPRARGERPRAGRRARDQPRGAGFDQLGEGSRKPSRIETLATRGPCSQTRPDAPRRPGSASSTSTRAR